MNNSAEDRNPVACDEDSPGEGEGTPLRVATQTPDDETPDDETPDGETPDGEAPDADRESVAHYAWPHRKVEQPEEVRPVSFLFSNPP